MELTMHILQLSKKNARAQKRLVEAAAEIGERLGIDEKKLDALVVMVKDPAVKAMKEREAAAALLEAVVEKLSYLGTPADVSGKTADEFSEEGDGAADASVSTETVADEQLTAETFAEMNTKDELIDLAKEHDLPVSGTKVEIAERILAADSHVTVTEMTPDEPSEDA